MANAMMPPLNLCACGGRTRRAIEQLCYIGKSGGVPMPLAARSILVAMFFALGGAAAADPDPVREAYAAFQRGDYATALRLLRPLADAGNPEAQADLGLMYSKGNGVPQDSAEAFKWYSKAAYHGHPGSQLVLCAMLAIGRIVPQDYVHAHMWCNLAATHGAKLAGAYRDRLATKMTTEQIAEAQRLAAEWKPE
jgi:TPR repeat protein